MIVRVIVPIMTTTMRRASDSHTAPEHAAPPKPSTQSTAGLGLDRSTLRRLSVECECDPRTVIRVMRAARGEIEPIRGVVGQRVARLLAERGFIAAGKPA